MSAFLGGFAAGCVAMLWIGWLWEYWEYWFYQCIGKPVGNWLWNDR